MQELEKILEEINDRFENLTIADDECRKTALSKHNYEQVKYFQNAMFYTERAKGIVEEIIHKHMGNDGWIPVEERMPEERDSMFATLKGTDKWSKGMFEKISDDVNVTVEYEDGTRKTISAYTLDGQWKLPSRILKQKVIAWCPCPEPYKPKTHDKPPEHWPEWRTKFLGKFDRRM